MRNNLLRTSAVLAVLALPLGAHAQQPAASGKPSADKTSVQPQKPLNMTGSQTATKAEDQTMSLINREAANKVNPIGPDVLYKGWRARAVIGEDVYGPKGEELGEIINILVGPDGRASAIVVEGGGFLGFGDAAFRVPWSQVDLTAGQDGVKVSLTEDHAEELGLFDGPNWVPTGPREWRVTELVGDYARLRNGLGYGYVTDAVFGQDGKLLATLVVRDLAHGAGLYGYPFYDWTWGWDPGLTYYALPYDTADQAAAAPKVAADRFSSTDG